MLVRAEARVDAGAVTANCRKLASGLSKGAELWAVVKADGYGHGAEACARAAIDGGASRLCVATAAEAATVRAALPDARILVMGALTGGELDLALGANAAVSVWRDASRQLVSVRARAAGRPAEVHVKLDSGMGRLGNFDPAEVLAMSRACAEDPDTELGGVWTHFATADEPGDEHYPRQLAAFEEVTAAIRADHPDVVLHAANSAATLRDPASHFDAVRCGVAIYGMDPFGRDPAEHGLEPAMSLHSYVADVKRFEEGRRAGYGRTWRAPGDRWVGVLPIGYGDGYRRGLSNRSELLIAGRRRTVVGNVSMDNLTVDLGEGEPGVAPFDQAVLLGAQGKERILAEELAAMLGTINYEITCGISARVPRVST